MAYEVQLITSARKALDKLPAQIQERIALALALLRDTPRPPNAKKLHGDKDLYRVRVGDYRIIYGIHDKKLLILVIRLAHRREAYR